MKLKIVALTTCHNRRDLTLLALEGMHKLILPQNVELHICLVDDNSSDGTGSAVRDRFPSVVVLDGTGELFWAGGMRFAWANYVSRQTFDYLLVFNDDIVIRDNALATLTAAADKVLAEGFPRFAISGALSDPRTGCTAYGAVKRCSWWHPLRFGKVEPNGTVQECDTLNMNFALISHAAIESIGFLDSDFAHGKADYDFGLRLKANGGRVILASEYIGTCQRNFASELSIQPGLSFGDRWRRLTSIKEQPPKERAIYFRRHAGIFWPLYWILPYGRACVEAAFNWIKQNIRREGGK